jgi:FkbM family methyltransferase
VLLARCFEGKNDGFYVDVGAEDPVEGSITKYFYERGWRGINIEPVPFFFDRISNDRPRDINLNCVASDRDDQTLNLCVSEGTGLSTLDLERQEALKRNPERAVQLIEVQSQTLNSILSTHATQHIDFLKIDVEGHELAVLRGLDLTTHHPRVIVIETTLPSMHPGGRVPMQERPETAPDFAAIDQLVTAAGYRKVYFDGLNTWWINQTEPALADAFRTPANCFDTISPLESYRIIEQLSAKIEQLSQTVVNTETQLQEAQSQCQALQHGLAETEKGYAHLMNEYQQLSAYQQALLNSRSWKITAPLRSMRARSQRLLSSIRSSRIDSQP